MKHRIAIAAGLMIAQLVMSGCVAVVVPMRKRVEGVAHPPVLNFKAGTTKREEVLSALEGLYTGVSGPTYFWARWNESRWGFGGAIGGMSQGAGGAVATRHRLWRQRNLLASFNPDGVVKNFRICRDDELLRCIDQTIEEAALTDRAEPVTLEFERRRRMVKPTNVRYEVTREQIRYVDLKRSVQADGPIARLQSLALDDAKIPSKVAVAIETNGVRDIPKRLVGDVAPLEVWNLRRLLREIRPDLNPRPQPNLGPR